MQPESGLEDDMSNSKIKIIGIILAMIVAGAAFVLYKNQTPPPPSQPNTTVSETTAADASAPGAPTNGVRIRPRHQGAGEADAADSGTPAPVANLLTNWEEKLDDILTSSIDESEKAKQLLEMFPRLPEDAQVEVAHHLANLTADQDFGGLGKYLTDPNTPEGVIEVFMGDLLNRPNSVKLPLLVEVARNPQNPKASEAKDLLELYLEDDYGGDWPTWQAKVEQWLKDNPD